ncbi:NAD(P)-binding domain-containing protein [Bradyrhizobium barranii]|uniref:NAD(P)-binding domain-containing protein n=1 Tax=Bradyrhizobium barranii TaxID=2992140 RepID=A0ABY3QK26_9BRAD|nr:NAD(P)-binding domain-containing protein [Bradyrhizobium japonicum]UFW85929.1 NAD(P)-binding domain-containing protein [Bradyrhizobium japonicum]
MSASKQVAIIGAGPVGLAAAAHVLERGMTPIVLEAGPEAGHSVRQWQHVQLFSPWEYNVDKAAGRLLDATGWNSPDPHAYPTGAELLERYIDPLATKTPLKDRILTSSKVTGVSRQGFDRVKSKGREQAQFEIRYRNTEYPEGLGERVVRADAVIDASGTWASPNPAGANGLGAIGEKEAAEKIAYGMPDVLGAGRARYAGRTIAVLGSGHSAIGTLTDLAALKAQVPATEVIWLLRGDNPAKAFGGGANDKLSARGELGSAFAALVAAGKIRVEPAFRTTHLSIDDGHLRIAAGLACCGRNVVADELIVATGFRPDLSFLSEIRLRLDPAIEAPVALAPLIDPNEHSCGTVRPHRARELAQDDPGFYLAGIKSYGRAPTFLMITGYEQIRSIAAEIAGDKEAAARVELELPETGVCTRGDVEGGDAASGCCGGPAKQDISACCADDEKAKQAGATGCGCS